MYYEILLKSNIYNFKNIKCLKWFTLMFFLTSTDSLLDEKICGFFVCFDTHPYSWALEPFILTFSPTPYLFSFAIHLSKRNQYIFLIDLYKYKPNWTFKSSWCKMSFIPSIWSNMFCIVILIKHTQLSVSVLRFQWDCWTKQCSSRNNLRTRFLENDILCTRAW